MVAAHPPLVSTGQDRCADLCPVPCVLVCPPIRFSIPSHALFVAQIVVCIMGHWWWGDNIDGNAVVEYPLHHALVGGRHGDRFGHCRTQAGLLFLAVLTMLGPVQVPFLVCLGTCKTPEIMGTH